MVEGSDIGLGGSGAGDVAGDLAVVTDDETVVGQAE